jgi:phospholipase C
LRGGRSSPTASAGRLPDLSLIEPNFIAGHDDYRPAFGRAPARGVDVGTLDPPSSMLGGEAFLERIFNAYRSSTSESGSNVWNTVLLGRAGRNLRPRSPRTGRTA